MCRSLTAVLVAVVPVAAARAGHKEVGPVSIDWRYYGLGGGGPYIAFHDAPTKGKAKGFGHKLPVPTYGPVPALEIPGGHRPLPPRHPGFGYGWLGYRSPSPRPTPATVSVYPPPAALVVAPAGGCLKVAVKLPDPAARVTIDGAAAGGAGAERVYDSPPLGAGKTYGYTVTATWVVDGKEQTATRDVTGRPGETVTADFTR